MDRIETMRAFVTVARTGSFSAAADKLEKSPQLVSKYVSQLESHLATRLLNRTTRKVHLTEAGQQYLPRASQVLDEIDAMENQLGDLHHKAHGLLRISAPVAFSTRHLAPLLNTFQQQYPNVDVDLHLNDRKVDIVEEGFDVALRIGQLKSSSLIARRLTNINMIMCASPQYLSAYGTPKTMEDLVGHNYLRYSLLDNDNSPAVHRFLSQSPHNKIAQVSCNHGEFLCQSAVLGQGIALQPTFICSDEVKAGRLKIIMRDHALTPLHLYAMYAHRQLLASKVRAFINFAANYYGDTPYWDSCLAVE